LDGRPGSPEPNPEVADFLNAPVDLRRQFMLPVLYLLPTAAPQTEYQFPFWTRKSILQVSLVRAIMMGWRWRVDKQVKQTE
jgi:hypothetical protein